MAQATLDLKQLFLGRIVGDGQVTGITGRTLRSFTVEFFGEWSIGYDALHLDETVAYADGRQVRRHWALQFDAKGMMSGYDSQQAARLRGRPAPGRARLVFDRPRGLTPEIAAPHVILDMIEDADGAWRMEGRVRLLGLVLERTRATLRRN